MESEVPVEGDIIVPAVRLFPTSPGLSLFLFMKLFASIRRFSGSTLTAAFPSFRLEDTNLWRSRAAIPLGSIRAGLSEAQEKLAMH